MDEEKVQMNKNTADEQEQQDVPEEVGDIRVADEVISCLLYTSPSPRDCS